jgi:hypothetical protein
MLKHEGIQFQFCRKHGVKCSIIESAQRTIRDRLYKYFTNKNTHRYIDVLQKFVDSYNDTFHPTTGMWPTKFTVSNFLAILNKMYKNICRVRTIMAGFGVGQYVRISKEKIKFTKAPNEILVGKYFELKRLLK